MVGGDEEQVIHVHAWKKIYTTEDVSVLMQSPDDRNGMHQSDRPHVRRQAKPTHHIHIKNRVWSRFSVKHGRRVGAATS